MWWHLRCFGTWCISLRAEDFCWVHKRYMSSFIHRRQYSIETPGSIISICIGAAVVSSSLKHKWKDAIFTAKANVDSKCWRISCRCPDCLESSECIFTIWYEPYNHDVRFADDAPTLLYLTTMFCSRIYFNPVMITLRVILNVKIEKSEVDSLSFRDWSQCPDLRLCKNEEFSFNI